MKGQTVKIAVALVLAAGYSSVCSASTSAVWEMTSFTDFVKGKFDGVSLGRDGRLALAPRLDTLFTSEQPVIWSVASGPDGALYAATGNRGRVFRIEQNTSQQPSSKLFWTADRPEVFAIAVDKKGVVYAASSPDGKIYRIENGNATEYFDPKTKYIWSLAIADDGSVYAGTGDDGRVFRITGAGKGDVYYDTGQGNVTSLTLDQRGRLLAGTEPNGILYRITAKDKAFVLYDSTLPEIRAVSPNPDGSVYAVALGGSLAKKLQGAQASPAAQADQTPTVTTSVTVTADAGGDIKPPNPPAPAKPQEAAPAPATPAITTATTSVSTDTTPVEKSAIYRINADNTVDTLWSSKEENVYDILPAPAGEFAGQIYFTTDASGRIYRLSRDSKLTLVAQTNEAEATRLLQWKGSMLAATGNMGKIYSLGTPSNTPAHGTYESPVFDAGSVAQWGRLRWQGENGAGKIVMRTRSGNSIRPDATWSDWSDPMAGSDGTQIKSPNARFLQYQAELTGSGAIVENVSAAYLPQNNPPAVHSVTVLTTVTATTAATPKAGSSASAPSPYSVTVTDTGDSAPVTSTGTSTQTLSRATQQQLMISWQADDPDGDKLVYEVAFRGEGEREWKILKKDVHDSSLTIDGDALADGRYYFKVTASDREANAPAAAKEADLTSSPVLIDNTPPVIHITSNRRNGGTLDLSFEATDSTSALRRAEYSIDAGSWTPVAPVDGILDSPSEEFRLHLDSVPAGEHVLVVRVADSGGNTGLAKVILR
jgi:WD40 repeat protein